MVAPKHYNYTQWWWKKRGGKHDYNDVEDVDAEDDDVEDDDGEGDECEVDDKSLNTKVTMVMLGWIEVVEEAGTAFDADWVVPCQTLDDCSVCILSCKSIYRLQGVKKRYF